MRKISPPAGFDFQPVETLGSRYTDWAIPAPASLNKQEEKERGPIPPQFHCTEVWLLSNQFSQYVTSDLELIMSIYD
jgi:hypothetical protein